MPSSSNGIPGDDIRSHRDDATLGADDADDSFMQNMRGAGADHAGAGLTLDRVRALAESEAMRLSLGSRNGCAVQLWDESATLFKRLRILEESVCHACEVRTFAQLGLTSAATFTELLSGMTTAAASRVHTLLGGNDEVGASATAATKLCDVVQALRMLQQSSAGTGGIDVDATLCNMFGADTVARFRCGDIQFLASCAKFVDEQHSGPEHSANDGAPQSNAGLALEAQSMASSAAVLCPRLQNRANPAKARGVTVEEVSALITSAPLLQPLAVGSIWRDALASEHRRLAELCRKIARADASFAYLQASPSKLCRVDAAPSCDKLRAAASTAKDPRLTAIQLVSLCKYQQGVNNMPVQQITTAFKQAFESLSPDAACEFVFDTLAAVPDWAALRAGLLPLLLKPLTAVLGSESAMESQLIRTFEKNKAAEHMATLYCAAGYAGGSRRCLDAYLGAFPSAIGDDAPVLSTTATTAASGAEKTPAGDAENHSANSGSTSQANVRPPTGGAAPTAATLADSEGAEGRAPTTGHEAAKQAGGPADDHARPTADRAIALASSAHDAKEIIEKIRNEFELDNMGGVWADTTKNALVRLSAELYSGACTAGSC